MIMFTKIKAFCGCGLKIQCCPLGVMEVSLGANWNGFEILKPTTMARKLNQKIYSTLKRT